MLARERTEKSGYGSGTVLFSNTFGEMGLFIGVLAVIFGAVAAAFFARSRIGKKATV